MGQKASPATSCSDAAALKADRLTIARDGQPIVHNISFKLAPGEIACLVGRSGTGKTTIFHTLSGLARPDEGSVSSFGRDITGVAGQVSYMLQKDLLLENLRVKDNVSLPVRLRGVSRTQAYEQVAPLLERFGIAEVADRWPSQLSGGMRQRAALLRTYMMGHEVILLDEPFSALDALTRAEIRSWFSEVVAELGLTALVITHDVDEAAILAQRIFVLAGDPQAGRPSELVGTVEVAGRTPRAADFDLTEEFLDAKRQVHELLRRER